MDTDVSVTFWLEQLKAGEPQAARPLWERYFQRMVQLAQRRLQGASRAVVDEEDVALSAFKSFCKAAEEGRFPRLEDRDDLWRLLVVLTERKAVDQVRAQGRRKRGGGQVVHEGRLERGETSEVGQGLAGFAGREPTPDFAALVAEEYQRLLALLDDERLRQLAIAKLEGYSNEEIAARLEMALRTVERKLALIRKIWEKDGMG